MLLVSLHACMYNGVNVVLVDLCVFYLIGAFVNNCMCNPVFDNFCFLINIYIICIFVRKKKNPKNV